MEQPNIWDLELGSQANLKEFSRDVNVNDLFTRIYQLKLNKAGKKITADDINNLIKILSENVYYYQHGGTFEFKHGLTYPKDAIVKVGNIFYISTQETSVEPGVDETWKNFFSTLETPADINNKLDAEIENVNALTDEKIQTLRNELINDDNEMRASIALLNSKTDSLESLQIQTASDLSLLSEQVDGIDSDIENLKTKSASAINDIVDIKSTLNNHSTRLVSLESSSNTADQRLTNQASAINNLNTMVGSNIVRISQCETAEASLRTDVDNHYNEFVAYKESNDDAVQTIQQTTYTKDEIDQKIVSLYKLKGSVETVEDLPQDAENGDTYNVIADGMNYTWIADENRWDTLGTSVDVPGINAEFESLHNDVSNINDQINNINSDISAVRQEMSAGDSELLNKINANSTRINDVNTSLQQMISDLKVQIQTEMYQKIADHDRNVHADLITIAEALQGQIQDVERDLLELIMTARESKTVTIPAHESTDVSFDNIDCLGMDVRVLVLDNNPESVTYNKYINSEGVCTIAFDHDKYTVYNETDEDLQFIVFLGVCLTNIGKDIKVESDDEYRLTPFTYTYQNGTTTTEHHLDLLPITITLEDGTTETITVGEFFNILNGNVEDESE